MKRVLHIFSLIFLLQFSLQAESLKSDFTTTFDYLLHGSYSQFESITSLSYLGTGALVTGYTLHEDKRLSPVFMRQKSYGYERAVADLSIAFNFPLIPLTTYTIGRRSGDDKLKKFSMETVATMYLTLAEVWALSQMRVHKRPDEKALSVWETALRGPSSFPSGHSAAFATLFFKTFQYYGPLYSILPFALMTTTALERVKSGKHYTSDVVATIFLSGMASEGVRVRAQNSTNHPYYKLLLEHDFRLTLGTYEGHYYPILMVRY